MQSVHTKKRVIGFTCPNSLVVDEEEATDDLTSLSWLQDNNLLNKICFNKNRSSKEMQHSKNYSNNRKLSSGHSRHKPPYSYSKLIFMAIESSPYKAMMVCDIYKWLINNFPYFATAPAGWKNNIRHTLSLRKCFKKVIRSINNFGKLVDKDDASAIKGAYWFIDQNKKANLSHSFKKTGHCMLVCKPKYEIPKFVTNSLFSQIQNRKRYWPVVKQFD